MMPANPPPARSLADLRQAYQACREKGGGRCMDDQLAGSLIDALEAELRRSEFYLDRSGTVYHMPRVPKPGT